MLVEPESPESIAAAVEHIVRSEELRGRLAEAGRDRLQVLAAHHRADARAPRGAVQVVDHRGEQHLVLARHADGRDAQQRVLVHRGVERERYRSGGGVGVAIDGDDDLFGREAELARGRVGARCWRRELLARGVELRLKLDVSDEHTDLGGARVDLHGLAAAAEVERVVQLPQKLLGATPIYELLDEILAVMPEGAGANAVTLAKAGAGLAQTYRYLVEDLLKDGSLVEVLPEYADKIVPLIEEFILFPAFQLPGDLKQRGLLDDTLVVWTTEFGRTPFNAAANAAGREHHHGGRDSADGNVAVLVAGLAKNDTPEIAAAPSVIRPRRFRCSSPT